MLKTQPSGERINIALPGIMKEEGFRNCVSLRNDAPGVYTGTTTGERLFFYCEVKTKKGQRARSVPVRALGRCAHLALQLLNAAQDQDR